MSRQAKILIVDDDPVFVNSTRAVLESKYLVSTASDGDEGLRKVAEVKPDLVILDVIMPTKDGFAACEQMKKDPRFSEIPVIILTSFAHKRGESNIPVSAGLTLEAEAYVDKPVAPQKLLETVERLLNRAGFR